MTDELDLDLNLDDQENINRVEKRIKNLSEKVKLTSEERDEKDRLLKEREEQLTSVSKENEFLKGFNKVSTKYEGSSEYQDKIWEKVNQGYDVEDATISVLAKEGKYNPVQAASETERESAAGGSASTAMAGNGQKSLQEMSKAEMRDALLEAEAKGEFKLN